METARFAETAVLPTPPFPPVTVMTLTGREAFNSARADSRSGDNRASRMGRCSTKFPGETALVQPTRHALLQLRRNADQPNALLRGGVQVLGYPLTVANI